MVLVPPPKGVSRFGSLLSDWPPSFEASVRPGSRRASLVAQVVEHPKREVPGDDAHNGTTREFHETRPGGLAHFLKGGKAK